MSPTMKSRQRRTARPRVTPLPPPLDLWRALLARDLPAVAAAMSPRPRPRERRAKGGAR